MTKFAGEIVIKPGIDVWPHEMRTAQALANAGYKVTFLKRNPEEYKRTADIKIGETLWEIKSPKSDKLKKVERTLRDAIHQSPYVVYDSQRIKSLNDNQIMQELHKWATNLKSLKGLLFVNKKRNVILIK